MIQKCWQIKKDFISEEIRKINKIFLKIVLFIIQGRLFIEKQKNQTCLTFLFAIKHSFYSLHCPGLLNYSISYAEVKRPRVRRLRTFCQ